MRIGSTITTLVSLSAMTALSCGLVAATATTASAAPAAAHAAVHATTSALPAVAGPSDSDLAALGVSGSSLTALSPAFDPATHDYEVVGNDNSPATVTPTVDASNATVAVTSADGTDPLVSGTATVPLTRGRNDIHVTVTSSDSSTTSTYRVTVWRLAAPTSQIVRLAGASGTVFGGARMSVTLSDGAIPANCNRQYGVGDQFAQTQGTSFDPATGLTTDIVTIPEKQDHVAGKADLVLTNSCSLLGGGFVQAVTTSVKAVTYTAGFTVTSADIPATVTSGSPIVIHGSGVSEDADIQYWMTNPDFVPPPGGGKDGISPNVAKRASIHPDAGGGSQGNVRQLRRWGWTGDGNTLVYPAYAYGDSWYAGNNQRTLHVGFCPPQQGLDITTCTTVFSKVVTWVAPVPNNVSFTPSSGPVGGGTPITLRGRFVLSGTEDLVVKVGGQTVPDWSRVTEADFSEDFAENTQGTDAITFPAPASITTGPVSITVSNDVGTAVARGTFTYSAKPTIASISPASVANSGGSAITVKGTAFGTAGTPTVIIDGVKSPRVTRVSASQLSAIVPAATGTTGPVGVSVSSPQGGGISSAASLTLVAPTTVPTVTKVSPASGHATDDITLTGTGFGAAGTVGVSVDGQWSLVTASSATSITFEVPATDTAGAKDLVVGATTGAVTKPNGFTVLADDGITSVTPSTVPSYATGNAAKVAIDGSGFGTTGTVKVGSAAAVAYTATSAGTHIAGVVVPTSAAGVLPVVVTPTGAKAPLAATIHVTGPTLSYVGPDPFSANYGPADINSGQGGQVLAVPTTGGSAMRINGSGFGTGGTLTLGTTPVTTTTWSDTAITFTAPAHAAGNVSLTVAPTSSSLTASRPVAISYVVPAVSVPTIGRIASVVDQGHADRSDFDPPNDASNAFTMTGTNLAGTDATKTSVVISDGTDSFTLVPTAVSQTSLTFAAPRGFTNAGGKDVQVITNLGSDDMTIGVNYLEAGAQITVSPASGLCLRTTTPASGSTTYNPAVVTIANTGDLFGDAGTVTMDGVTITPTSYATGQVVVSMANLASDLAQPWGNKTIVITPSDTTLPAQQVGFTCGVTPTVTTTANGSASQLTVAAGTAYTLGFTTTGFIGSSPFTATAPGGYEYVTAADFANSGFDNNVHAGAPVGAGDYFVRVAVSRATYATERYLGFQAAAVEVTISGTPVTITPVSNNGASFTYKGQLGDGTGSSSTDFHFTATSTADAITKVTYEYRDSVCETAGPNDGWNDGLPKDVALSQSCGGDGSTPSHWDVRVASFEMTSTGTDRSIFYQATEPTTQITITPRNLTVATARADKVYDGTTTATLDAPTLTGVVDGDDVSLRDTSSTATFASPSPGVNKPVTLSADLSLVGQTSGDYTLTNPRPTIVGTITKASAVLSLAESTSSVLLSQHTPVTITPTVDDSRTGNPVDSGANVAPVVLTSQTPTICTVSGTTVTAHTAGTCVIAATEAASTNYNAATAESDPTSTTETIEIHVFPAPQAISVVADDLTVAVGDTIAPTSQVSGLFDGDSVDGVDYDYFSGATRLGSAPTAPGTYKIVPKGGTLTAANTAVYSNPTSFSYVAGTLVITALPPTIGSVSPASGPTAGGTRVTITGTRLDTVKTVRIGGVTLRVGDFTVNADGTSLSFVTPKVAAPGPVDLILGNGTATAADSYTYTKRVTPVVTNPGAPTHLVTAGRNGRVVVSFTPPASNGGAAITSYQISTNGGRTWHTVTTKAGPHGNRTATVKRLKNGVTYRVMVRAVNSHGAGKGTTVDKTIPNSPKLGNVRHAPASEVAIPKHPKRYHGKKAVTRAKDTSHNGTWAHPISTLGSRQMTVGEAATLSKASLFGFDSAVLTKAGHAAVRNLAGHLRLANAVRCEGYTDYAGAAGHEKSLSAQRAEAVCKALVHDGAHVTFTTHGYGGARPVVIGGTPTSRAGNRRVVVIVTK
jgi:outer membrane protein OmpA-like peptidoglycan-associated protein